MSEPMLSIHKPVTTQEPTIRKPMPGDKLPWETPKMQDVSEEVMAQPYIRFT